ncbi:tryptophan-rich sensory protein [Patescibacteria group bacterium]|nr:tryptophan-rich sensory protein [Patescibacteria group bacterium]MBU0974148.1 tryptophan-rich sensory protein [Patescibacteria group bacterium]
MKIKKPKLLILSIVFSQLAGFVGAFATTPAIPGWYSTLIKPNFNPPSWIFGPVWTALYTLMGISLYLVWSKGFHTKNVKPAVQLFVVHLVFNSLWSIAFFGLKNIALALLIIIILWTMIAYLIKLFWKINKKASYLLIPYILWVSFATVLNYSIWILN